MNTPVSYELAKLLKEKEFTVATFYYYENEKLVEPYLENGSSTDTDFIVYLLDLKVYFNKWSKRVSAPSIAEVIMWLYEKHGIWISVKGDDGKTFKYELHKWIWYESEKILKQAHVTFGEGIFDISSEKFNLPTETYEAAIKYALEKCI